ncbi:ABC transporter permease [Clostridium sp. Marseille-P2415]|uniref:ABC transporter permease n=1 Tax=Clostridium sp. Marseille-P2415 TaxID=1805471 RepID=UPI0009885663|nr:ABC transporter permease [Clostridium sp. Marseille-P2415]
MRPFKAMFKTELKLSLRGMDMFIFAICLPVVMVVVLGIIYGRKPAFEGAEYTFLEQSFAALSTISICAGGVMGLPLLISDYRHKKILKRFQVTPVRPIMILAVHIAIYAFYSIASLTLIYGTAKAFFGYRMNGSLVSFLISFLFVMLSMFSIGVMVGGIAPNTKAASIAASLLYFPMLILSGATLPYEVMPAALKKASDVLPLTQGIKLLKAASLGLPMEHVAFSIMIMAALLVLCMGISLKFFRWE